MKSKIKTAEELVPGDVILTDYYDANGMLATMQDAVTGVRPFKYCVRVSFEHDRPVKAARAALFRVKASWTLAERMNDAHYGTVGHVELGQEGRASG